MSPRPRYGFTLIELSIVLVIVGLLAGGILVGRDLIKAAELRSVYTTLESYKTAVNTFKGKYNCLPGDCPNATDFFGAIHPDPYICPNGVSPDGILTCDGTGDGDILGDPGPGAGSPYDPGSRRWEVWHTWVQLSAAGLVAGKFTGRPGSGGGVLGAEPGTNVPTIKGSRGNPGSNSNAGILIQRVGSPVTDPPAVAFFPGHYGNAFILAAPNPGYSMRLELPIFTPEEAINIDTKADDGLPAKGVIRSFSELYGPDCVTDPDPVLARYNLSDSGINCQMISPSGF